MKTEWYSKKSAVPDWCDQGVVCCATTGETIAVSYKHKNTPILAAAPELARLLGEVLGVCELNLDDMEDDTRKIVREASCFLADLETE